MDGVSKLEMLSYRTEAKLAELLWHVAESEKTIERSRQDLAAAPDFDPYAAFEAIDRLRLHGLRAFDLKEFMIKAGVPASQHDLELLVLQYDNNNDSRLDMSDFMQFTLPSENLALRHRAEARRSGLPLRFAVEQQLARHIQLEANQQMQLSSVKRMLMLMPDFTNLAAFRTLDREGLGYVTQFQLRTFLRQHGYVALDSDLDAIVRRVDTDGDSRLSYEDLVEGITTSRLNTVSSTLTVHSPLRHSAYQSSPMRESSLMRESSPARASSPLKDMTSSPYRSSGRSPVRSPVRSPMRSGQASTYELEEVVSTFRSQINLARDFEQARISLAQQPDFTIPDFFKLVDLLDKGYLLSTDLESFFADLGVPFTSNDVYLVMKHFSSLRDSRLRMSDFSSIWLPKDTYYARVVQDRPPQVYLPQDRMAIFSTFTLEKITNGVRLLIECEQVSEDLRRSLSSKSWVNLLDVFRGIDRNDDGYITIDEFGSILREFGVYADIKDLESLVAQYDKNHDGRVSYSEFIEEVTPKLP